MARHPYFSAAIALHAAGLAVLYSLGPYKLEQAQRVVSDRRIEVSLDQARRLQMQRHLQRLEELQRQADASSAAAPAVAGSGALPAVDEQLRRARLMVERMESTEQSERAKELARLLKIPPAAALKRVQAEDTAKAAKTPAAAHDATSQAAQLEQRARDVLARQQQRQARQSQGSEVAAKPGGGARGKGDGGDSQVVSSSGAGGGGDASLAGGALQSDGGFVDPRNYARAKDVPAVDPAGVRQATGRTLGAGGTLATRVYLDRWNVVGPFAAHGVRSLDEPYPPELGIDLDAVYAGLGGRVLQWQPVESPTYPFVPPDRAEDAIYYAWTELRVDRDVTVTLDIGADDDSKMWLDDEVVWHSGDEDKPWYHQPFYRLESRIAAYDLVEGRRRVKLTAGRHTLLFKLYNGIDLTFFSVVVTP